MAGPIFDADFCCVISVVWLFFFFFCWSSKTHGTGREGFYFSKFFFFFNLFLIFFCSHFPIHSILLRVVMFESSRLKGLLNRSLSLPPIPFESGVDFWLNCPVCLVKVTVVNLCHLIPSVTPNSAAEGYRLSALLVWWLIAALSKIRKRLQKGLNPASSCCICVC